MTIKQLKQALEKLGTDCDDLVMVRPGTDHSYFKIGHAGIADAEQNGREFFEYFDDSNMSKDGKKVKVLFIE